MIKDDLVGKLLTGFSTLGSKTYSCLLDDDDQNKEAKGKNGVS